MKRAPRMNLLDVEPGVVVVEIDDGDRPRRFTMRPAVAREFAEGLRKKADEAERIKGGGN
jgi:hypothetical protein